MAIKFKEIRRFLARNIRLSICFLDGQYHNYLLVSDISASEYDELYVFEGYLFRTRRTKW